MSDKIKKILITTASVIAWIIIWEIAARLVGSKAFFAGFIDTIKALFTLVTTADFWLTVLKSMLRILLGYILGIALGSVLAFLCIALPFLRPFVTLGMSIIKATPVASVIMIIWIFVGSASVPSVIGVLMVSPIIWQNLLNGYYSVDKELDEVSLAYSFSRGKRFRLLVFPTIVSYFVPAALTSVGLAWKSGIAAEIIAVAKNSIGYNIKNSKDYFESEYMLAWTLVVILISLAFEYGIKLLAKGLDKNNGKI